MGKDGECQPIVGRLQLVPRGLDPQIGYWRATRQIGMIVHFLVHGLVNDRSLSERVSIGSAIAGESGVLAICWYSRLHQYT